MALYPDGDKLDAFSSRYVLANLAARRAAQIRDGAPILVETRSTHPLTIALEEIAEGAVKPIIVEGEIQAQPVETLESIDLLAREAGGLDVALGDIGAILGEASGDTAMGGSTGRPGGFEEEVISLESLLEEEEADEDADFASNSLSGLELGPDEDEALLD
jgi:DNA-directed RNA polymerase subunit omega